MAAIIDRCAVCGAIRPTVEVCLGYGPDGPGGLTVGKYERECFACADPDVIAGEEEPKIPDGLIDALGLWAGGHDWCGIVVDGHVIATRDDGQTVNVC